MPEVNSDRTAPGVAAAAPEGALLDGTEGLGRTDLIRLLRADQLRRWQAGQRVPTETYLREVPALRDDPELAIDVIFSEFLLRRDVLGEAPALDEYLERFPEHATVLRHQLELDRLEGEDAGTQGRGGPAPATAAAPPGASDWTVLGAESGAAAAAPAVVPSLPGYEVRGELGRGGMGLVLRGRDLHLGRDLAVKLLHEEFRGQPHLIRRFVNEARICGRLQHPGVVPVHALGTLPDGRPYFTMKLVEGHTLADLLDDRGDPGQDLPRFLGIFEPVCQAVAYAHSKGVIHRDLKPGNVMVGAFGEVQVMDWGLAKVLDRDPGGAAAEGSVAGDGPDDADRWLRTQLGHALGTLPYMPPEQARGEVGRMDERCDVFSLGAILCEVLTGRPPFAGGGAAELLARARACDQAEALAGLDACGADAELVRLAKGCLAAEPSDRPRDAGEVARAVTAYLAGVQERLRQAEVERAAAQARAAAERRARRRAWALAAVVLLLALLGGGGGLWWTGLRAEQLRTVNRDLDDVADSLQSWEIPKAEAAQQRAEGGVANGGPPELCRRVRRMRDDLALADRLDRIRLNAAAVVDQKFDYASADRGYAAVFREQGLATEEEGAAAVAERIRGSVLREQLVAAVDFWAVATADPGRRQWLLAVARRVQPGEWSDRFRDPATWERPATLEQLAREADVAKLSAPLLAALGEALQRTGADPVPLLAKAQAQHPNDFWLNLWLGYDLLEVQPDEALGYFRVAAALRPRTSAVHCYLGFALYSKGRLEEAAGEYLQAIALDPRLAEAYGNLGDTLQLRGRLDEAVKEYRRAIDLDPQRARTRAALAELLFRQGRFAEGTEAYRGWVESLPAGDAMRPFATWELKRRELVLAHDKELPAILRGDVRLAGTDERLSFAWLCRHPQRRRYAASARFYAEAFADQSRLAEYFAQGYRHQAAGAAALAGCGQGEDAALLPDKVAQALRRQALAWLRADLAVWDKQVSGGTPADRARARQVMQYWEKEADLAVVRDGEALGRLPEAERKDWQKLWDDVAALFARAGAAP